MRANSKQAKGLEDPGDVPGVGAVKAQRRQTQAADNKDCVGHIVAENSFISHAGTSFRSSPQEIV